MTAFENKTDDDLAKIIWDYHHMNHVMERSGIIFALGGHDDRVASRTAELYLEGYAPVVVFSGLGSKVRDASALKRHFNGKSEADHFAEVAKKEGVPEGAILIENESTNTGENIEFTRKLLDEKKIIVNSVILVQKPYMERRTYATAMKQWPEVNMLVTSPQLSYEEYTSGAVPKDHIINSMVGDLQRIKEYPAKGFQIPQEMPEIVWGAAEELIKRGYSTRLIS